ncbi:hypothetical protein PG994_006198 [Apiospora phragmitis]|uniref:Ankyrin repeat protein n=1 Tax=Apiospora phragmitis TaxID=2905665 RepID=A0ABR1VEH9_9PEZI
MGVSSANQDCSAADLTWTYWKEETVPQWSALQYALSHKSNSIAALLTQKGEGLAFADDTKSPNPKQQHAIHIAAENGLIDVINMLVHEHHVDINTTDTNGETALHYATSTLENKKTLLFLIGLGAKLNQAAAGGITPLVKAMDSSCFINAFQLIKAGAEVKIPGPPAPYLASPVEACLANYPSDCSTERKNDFLQARLLEVLLKKGASVHGGYPGEPLPTMTADGYSGEPLPIMTAMRVFQGQAVQVLLRHGAQFPPIGEHPSIAAYVLDAAYDDIFEFLPRMQILFDCGVSRMDDPFDKDHTILQVLASMARECPGCLTGVLESG